MTIRSSPPSDPSTSNAPLHSPTEFLVTKIAVSALAPHNGRSDGITSFGPLDDPEVQIRVVHALGRGILAADTSAVQAAERAIAGRHNGERVKIIETLGALSAAAEATTSSALDPLVQHAARECGVSRSLIARSRAALRSRQTNRDFLRWVTYDPSGFSRWVWSTALRAAGGRVWDRNWATIAVEVASEAWTRICPEPPDDARSGWRPFDESAAIARRAAVDALVDAALSDDTEMSTTAWRDAILRAERTAGTLTWARFANQIRTEIGPTTWATVNESVAERTSIVVRDIPRIAGSCAMISLATEASTAPVRAAVVGVGARALTRFSDVDAALDEVAAKTRQRVRLAR